MSFAYLAFLTLAVLIAGAGRLLDQPILIDRRRALEAAPRARSQIAAAARASCLDRARGAGPLPAQPAHATSTGATGEPIRRYEHDHPGRAAARRCHEARQHPRRRRLALRRPRQQDDR